jgi:hypothetical protein
MVCMGSGSCTVSIFSCPALAALAGQASFFSTFIRPNPNPNETGCPQNIEGLKFRNKIGVNNGNISYSSKHIMHHPK